MCGDSYLRRRTQPFQQRSAQLVLSHNSADAVVEPLILDLLQWLAKRQRSYEEVIEAWRTSCPKLPVWEDASDRGLVTREDINGRCIVGPSPSGRAFLDRRKLPRQ